MNILHAIIFGIVQGLTEFLPISSSAHLRLTPLFLKIDDPGAGFSAVIQLGTVLAVVIYFWSDLLAALKGWVAGLTDATKRDTNDYKMGWAVFIGTIPVIVAGLLLKHKIEHEFRSLYIMAGGMIVMGRMGAPLGRAMEGHEGQTPGIEGGQAGSDQRHPEEDLPGFRPVEGVESHRRGGNRAVPAIGRQRGELERPAGHGRRPRREK